MDIDWSDLIVDVLQRLGRGDCSSDQARAAAFLAEDAQTYQLVIEELLEYLRSQTRPPDADSVAARLLSIGSFGPLIEEVDTHLMGGCAELALRALRSAIPADWERLYFIVECWPRLTPKAKRQCLQLVHMRHVLRSERLQPAT